MRSSSVLFAAALVAAVSSTVTVNAQTDPFLAELAAARRALVVAKLEARHFWQVEYPRKRRELNAAIRIGDAELRAMKRQLLAYEPFTRFSTGQPLSVTYEDLRLCILDAELRLNALRAERNDLVRFHTDEGRLLDLCVAEARERVAELEGGGMIELEVVTP